MFFQSAISFGLAWILTLAAIVMLVQKGAFDWIGSGSILRYTAVIALHLIGGAVGF